jgi:serine/threonine-protein kinase
MRQEGQPWWIWLLAVLAVLLLGVIGFLGAQILTALGPAASVSPSPSVPTVTVPTDWVGMKVIPVQQAAESLGLKTTVERKNDSTIPVDQVISTDPTGGTSVPKGSTVKLTVSAGQEMVAVPALVGQTRDEAAATLTGVGLRLGSVGQAFSADQPEGAVISSNPAAGVSVPKGSQVNIVLSRGPEPTPTPTPTPVPTPPPTPAPTPSSPTPSPPPGG